MPYVPQTKPKEPVESTSNFASNTTPVSRPAFRENNNNNKSKQDRSQDSEKEDKSNDDSSIEQSSGEQDCRYCIIV
jgi:hypothetical protein